MGKRRRTDNPQGKANLFTGGGYERISDGGGGLSEGGVHLRVEHWVGREGRRLEMRRRVGRRQLEGERHLECLSLVNILSFPTSGSSLGGQYSSPGELADACPESELSSRSGVQAFFSWAWK